MALTDEQMQDLRAVTKEKVGTQEGKHNSQAATNLNRTLRLCYSIRELTLGSFVK